MLFSNQRFDKLNWIWFT